MTEIAEFSPVFLLCSERSGSNLITRLLDSHPDFCGPPPSHLIRTLALNITRFSDIKSVDLAWHTLLDVSAKIMQSQLGIWRSHWDAIKLENTVQERSPRGIITAIYEAEAKEHGKKFCIIKENRIHLFLPYLILAFPAARYIWLVRDPRDMALSWKMSKSHPGDVRKGAAVWLEDQERFRQIYGYLFGGENIYRLRYEDLVQNPENTLSHLCDFLRVPYTNSMLDFHSKEDTKINAARISNWVNLSRPLISDNTGKFHLHLSKNEIGYIESQCRNEMVAHDYALLQTSITEADFRSAVEKTYGAEDIKKNQLGLSTEEEIRQARQLVIDAINSIPIKFAQ